MSEQTNQQEETKLSPEELAKRRKDLQEFYKKQIDILKLQDQYETLLASVEESRLKRLISMIRYAELTNPSLQPELESEDTSEESSIREEFAAQEEAPKKKERTLKKA